MKNKIALILSLIVFGCGLSSCRGDKSSTPAENSDPQIANSIVPIARHKDGSHHDLEKIHQLSLDSKIILKNFSHQQFVEVPVFSQCLGKYGPTATEGSMAGAEVQEGLLIADLVPVHAFGPLDTELQCNFEIQLEDKQQSKTLIQISAKILNSPREENFQPFLERQIDPEAHWLVTELERQIYRRDLAPGQLHLRCGPFHREFEILSGHSPPPLTDTVAQSDFPKNQSTRCQIFWQNSTLPLRSQQSPPFFIHPDTLPPVKTAEKYTVANQLIATGQEVLVAHLRFKNPNPYKISIRMSPLDLSQYRIQIVSVRRDIDFSFFLDRAREFPVHWEMDATAEPLEEGFLSIEMGPHQEINLRGYAAPEYQCAQLGEDPDGITACFGYQYLHGIASDISNLPKIFYESWKSSSEDPWAPAIDWNSLTRPFRGYRNWWQPSTVPHQCRQSKSPFNQKLKISGDIHCG